MDVAKLVAGQMYVADSEIHLEKGVIKTTDTLQLKYQPYPSLRTGFLLYEFLVRREGANPISVYLSVSQIKKLSLYSPIE